MDKNTQSFKAFLVVKNRWTNNEYIYPKIFLSEKVLKSAMDSWDSTNSTITVHYF